MRFTVAALFSVAVLLVGADQVRSQSTAGTKEGLDATNRMILDRLEDINNQLRAAAAKALLENRTDLKSLPSGNRPLPSWKIEPLGPFNPRPDQGWRQVTTAFGEDIKVTAPEGSAASPKVAAPAPAEARKYAANIGADAQKLAEAIASFRGTPPANIRSQLSKIALSPESAATLRATSTDTSTAEGGLLPHVFIIGDGGFTLDHPAVGLLLRHTGQNQVCTGTLVRSNLVLTAAHCFCHPGTSAIPIADTFDKCMAWTDRPSADQYSFFISSAGLFSGRRYRIHNQYSFFGLRGDLALLEIDQVAGVEPVEIDAEPVAEGAAGRLVGYGMRAIRREPVVMAGNQFPATPPMPLAASNEDQARTVGIKVFGTQKARTCPEAPSTFCWIFDPAGLPVSPAPQPAQPPQGPSEGVSCPGDSGGPFLRARSVGGIGTWRISGVISAGSPLACGAKTTAYNMNLGAELHRQWLTETLNQFSVPNPSARAALRLKLSDSVPFEALADPDPTNQLVGRFIRNFEVSAGIRRLRLAINAADLRLGGPVLLELRRSPSAAWQTCQLAGGAMRAQAQGGLQICELENPAAGQLELRLSGRVGREIQLLATQWVNEEGG